MSRDIELSVVLPCLNEAETIGACIVKASKSMREMSVDGEIIVADNGSKDGSLEIAKKLGARIIEVPTKGYGSALIAGFQGAQGKYIIMGDADDSYSLDNLEPFLQELRKGFDLVMGNRFGGTIHKGAMPWLHRYIGNPILSLIGRVLFKSKIRDFHCGMRGMNRESILKLDLHTPGMEFASELVVKSILSGFRISEVNTDLRPDGRSRPPHLRTWRDGWRHLRFLLSYSPRWLFFYPGSAMSIIGLLCFSILLRGKQEILGIKFDLQTLVFSIFTILLGTQMIWFSILAKASSISKGFLPLDARWSRILNLAKQDAFYLLYLALILIDSGVLTLQVHQWITFSFGELDASQVVRKSLLGGTLTFLGFQALISHFLLSIIMMGSIRTNRNMIIK